MSNPKITFGIIVLNGEPFTRYNLRALYPFAHQIIIVEGACSTAKYAAFPDGHSSDGTLESIKSFKTNEDPDNKIIVVTAIDEGYINGFWPEKDEMSQAYARRATGDYLWQIDIDEFYMPGDMQTVVDILKRDPEIKEVVFPTLTFWGGLDYLVNSFRTQNDLREYFSRLFAWKAGYQYKSHRPPTVIDEKGNDLHRMKIITPSQLEKRGIYMYHYGYLLPKQVKDKSYYYATVGWKMGSLKDLDLWYQEIYLKLSHPFRVHREYHNLSWLKRYRGKHPPQLLAMIEDIKLGKLKGVEMRAQKDIELLLNNPYYQLKRDFLEVLVPLSHLAFLVHKFIYNLLGKTALWINIRLLTKNIFGSGWGLKQ